jgi:hypothetical protein
MSTSHSSHSSIDDQDHSSQESTDNHDHSSSESENTSSIIVQPLLTVADFNGDGIVNDSDINDLNSRIANSNYHPLYDLNADSVLNNLDQEKAVATLNQAVPLLDQQIAQATQATMRYYGPSGIQNAIADGYGPWVQEVSGHGIHFFNPILASQIGNSPQLVIDKPTGLNYDSLGNLKAVFYIRLPKLLSGATQDPLNPLVLPTELSLSNQIAVDPSDDNPPVSFDTISAEDWHTHERAWISGLGSSNSELIYFEEDLSSELFNARVSTMAQNQEPLFPLSDILATPKFWMLHGWFHSLNPDGTFANTNPDLSMNAVGELGSHHTDHTHQNNELIIGTDGIDEIHSTSEGDLINGFNGDDNIISHEGDDFIWGGRGNDILDGGEDNDVIYGGPDDDQIMGKTGDDRLFGGTGNDQLQGNECNDLLRGSIGNDTLTGNSGHDYFVLAPSEGTDTITDFKIGIDKLLLENGLTIEALSINQSSNNTLIEFNGETLAILNGINSADIVPETVFTYSQPEPDIHHHQISLFRFQDSNNPGKYLYAGQKESENIALNYPQFQNEGFAFNGFNAEADANCFDDLIALYRFRNTSSVGGYLYVGEQERQNINNSEFSQTFVEEGFAFYAYSADSNKGEDIYRFRNTALGNTYLYVGEQERQNILTQNVNYVEEGLAFEVPIRDF